MTKESQDESAAGGKKPPLRLGSEEEFDALMESVDQAMIDQDIPITAREVMAGIEITKRYDVVLDAFPRATVIVPGLFTPEQVGVRVSRWIKDRYGDRLNVDFTMGRVVVPLRGSRYSIRFPTVYGTVNFVCDPATVGVPRAALGNRAPPICNVLDLVDGLTVSLAKSLKPGEVLQIIAGFHSGMECYMSMQAIKDQRLVTEAWGDHDAAVSHLMENNPQLGLSKWSSCQATEKLVKAYLTARGAPYPKSHDLAELFRAAASLGLPAPPTAYVEDLACSPGARYGDVAVTVEEACKAHLISIEVCGVLARAVGQAIGREMPEVPEPMLDGVPLGEFIRRHSRPQ